MKKSFHVFFLFVLFAFFAVNSAWAADVTLQTDAQTGEKYVNMPAEDTDELTISSEDIANGLTSFKVYGGSYDDLDYRNLLLSVPEGYKLLVSGSIGSQFGDVWIHDGSSENGTSITYASSVSNETVNIFASISSGNAIFIQYKAYPGSGLDLTVSIVKRAVNLVEDGEGGLFVNMPVLDTNTVDLVDYVADGITSFKVYDDGGKYRNYSKRADGYLILTAPTNYKFVITGSVNADEKDITIVYDGDGLVSEMLLREYGNISQINVQSSGNVIALQFGSGSHANYDTKSGLDLFVTLIPLYDITIASVAGGEVKTNKEKAMQGEVVSLTIIPASDYLFDKLKVTYGENGSVTVTRTDNTATFTMPASDVTVTPSWAKLHNVGIGGATGGYIEADKTQVTAGETVELTITTNDHYSFTGIEVKDSDDKTVAVTLSGGKATFTMPESDVTVTGSWVRVYDVEISNVTGGNVAADKETATAGEKVSLTITRTPSSRYVLAGLEVKTSNGALVDVEISSDKSSATFTMPSFKVSVTPTWVEEYVVSIQGVTGGTVETNKSTASVGTTVELTITTNDHYSFTGIEVKDSDDKTVAVTLSGGKATFTMPESDVTVTGSWVRVYDVEISNVTGGNVAADKETATAGEKVSLTITRTPSSRYVLAGLEVKTSNGALVDVEISSDKSSATFTMPSFKVSVTPTWVEEYVVSIQGVTGGTVETNKSTASVGTTVELTITTNDHYSFTGIEVKDSDDKTVAVTLSGGKATFTMPESDVTVTGSWVRVYDVEISNVTGGNVAADKETATAGEKVSLTITRTPSSRYVLAGLEVKTSNGALVDVEISSDKSSATFTMPSFKVSVTPTWVEEYVVSIQGVTGGTVETNKSTASVGTTVELTITPDASNDYLFKSIKVVKKGTTEEVAVDVTSVTEADGGTATFTMPASDVTVTVTCEKQYGVTITNVDGGNVQTSKVKATQGTTVELTITPDASNDYLFDGIKVLKKGTNEVVSVNTTNITETNGGKATFTMPKSDVIVTPSWTQIERSVTITNVTGGTVTTDKEKTTYGETVTLTIAPTSGYQFNSLTVKDAAGNAVDVTLSNNKTSATFSMPKSDVTVTPSWNAVLVDDGEGGLYVNMPETGTKELSIPENVKSFKVYDDGGKGENHSLHAAGYLVLNAPEGYQLQVTGTARYSYAYFFIYDGDSEAKKLFDKEYATNGIDVGTIRSSGNKLTVYFKSRSTNAGSNYSGLDLTVSLVKVDFGAVSIAKADDGKIHATINGDYAGKDTLVISEAIEVDAVDYNRELEVDVPVTALLPVTLPAGTTVNAEFYTLEKVEQVEGMKWQATMKYIGDGNLPQPNTPYAVILPTGQSELKFDLPSGKKATVQTGDINKVCGVDASCKLDENGKITDDWFFTGTYAYKEWKEDDEELGLAYAFSANDNPGGAAKGKFGKIKIDENSSEYPRAKAMRCYLRKRDANVKLQQQNQAQMVAASPYVAKFSINNLPETIDVEFVKDDAKGGRTVLHGRMNTVTGEFKMLRDYDLKGRKVNSTNRARGAYYGKKVMKK